MTGRVIVVASWVGTGTFAAAALLDAAGLHQLRGAVDFLGVALFMASLPISLYALGKAAVRTARGGERITVSGLFFLRGSAPVAVRRALLGPLLASVVVAAITAPVQPFGILVPVYPLSLIGLWGARHGKYPLIASADG